MLKCCLFLVNNSNGGNEFMNKNERRINRDAFTNEMKLLLLCSVKDPSPAQQEEIESIIIEGIDWGLFLQIVKKHRIYTLVFHNLAKIKSVDIDKRALSALQQMNQQKVLQSVKLTAELVSLARLMNDHGIRVLSLKGPLLARNIYGDVSFRFSKDLDILVSEQDIERTGQLLLANGYESTGLEVNLSPKQKAHAIKTQHHFVYKKPGGIIVELHWRRYQFSVSQFNRLWLKRREQVLSGQIINVLSAEDEFIYLLIHGSIHGYARLRWLCDIAEIMKKDELPWQEIIAQANEMDIMQVLVQAAILCDCLLNTRIPELLKVPTASNKLGQRMAAMAIPIIIETDEMSSSLNMHLRRYTLLRSKGVKAKLKYFLALFNPQLIDYEAIGFSDRYYFMYYLTRPFYKIQRIMKKNSERSTVVV